jgi:3-hydroxyacyl-[acyl-carrier-protein] dehydratase
MSDIASALDTLPHGPEFRFLDRLLSLDPGRSGTGEYLVRGDEPCLGGHFPGDPLFPGVLLVEAAAQLAGTIAQKDPNVAPLPRLRLAGIRAVKFFGTARPGETILLQAVISGRFGSLIHAGVMASVQGRQILTGELTLGAEQTPAD